MSSNCPGQRSSPHPREDAAPGDGVSGELGGGAGKMVGQNEFIKSKSD